MSINYNAIVGYRAKATLPSVETWGNNMNILRDPPKSVTTRRVDKVGDTSEITQMIQDSGDRACEVINVYARGTNPMVGISYNNYGNNGGQRGNRTAGGNAGRQAFLPYRVMRDGAFVPPTYDQRDLLPLSRLPRAWTSSFTQPGFADFSKKAMCPTPADKTAGIKSPNQVLKGCIRPTATYQLEAPTIEAFEVRYHLKDPTKVKGAQMDSGANYTARFNGIYGDGTAPLKEINQNPTRGEFNLNKNGDKVTILDTINVDTDRYLHDTLKGEYQTNISDSANVLMDIDQVLSTPNNAIQQRTNIDHETGRTFLPQNNYENTHINTYRNLPYHESRSNIGYGIGNDQRHEVMTREYLPNRPNVDVQLSRYGNGLQSFEDPNSRNFHLKPTVNPGEYEGRTHIPTFDRQEGMTEFDTAKTRLRENVYEMQQQRNQTVYNY